MGFDNECILNIQSLAGEYFCPVCRLLVYPNEALQSQCTHLYCKPCLTYVVGTTRACPYDGYLVTEADSKPLIESNKALAETIGKIVVHCLYHRSGCTWQGQLSECTTHCAGCAFGNSPVVCNRCGTQIVHRQVQEHAQNCPGVQPHAPQAEGTQDATGASATVPTTAEQNQATIQAGISVSQAHTAQAAVAPNSGQDQNQMHTSSQPQVAATQAVPTPEQWYQQQQQQQQYQQYYQQYPGYDPYQQQYQHYDPYQQQAHQQYQQNLTAHPAHVVQGQQPQMYIQPQPHQQPQPPLQVQAPVRPQLQPQHQVPVAAPQAQMNPPQQVHPAQSHPQMAPQPHPPLQGHQHPQVHPSQLQVQPHLQQRPQVPQPQTHLQMQQPHPQLQPQPTTQLQPQPTTQLQPQLQHQQHPQSQSQSQPQPQPQAQPQPQPQQPTQAQPQPQAQPQAQPQQQPQLQPQPQAQPQLQAQHPPVHSVTGHQSYPQPQTLQQMPPGTMQQHHVQMHPQQQIAPQQVPQHTLQMQGQYPPQQLPQMRPSHPHAPIQQQQQPPMLPPHGQRPNMPPAQPVHLPAQQTSQPIHQHAGMLPHHQQNTVQQQAHGQALHPQMYAGQTPGLVHNQPLQPSPYAPQQAVPSQLRPQVPPASLPQHVHAHQQLPQNLPISHGLPNQSQNAGRPVMPNQGALHQQFQQSPGGPALVKPTSTGGVPQYQQRTNIHPQSSAEQQHGYMHQSAPSLQSGIRTPVSSVQPSGKPELQAEAATQKSDTKESHVLPSTSSQGADSAELKTPRSESELKSVEGEKSINEDKSLTGHLDSHGKEISDSLNVLEKDPKIARDGSDEPVIKQMVKEEATAISETKQVENSVEETRIQDDVQKNFPSQHREALDGKGQNGPGAQQLPQTGSDSIAPLQSFPGTDNGSQAVALTSRSVPDRIGSERNNTQISYQDRNSSQPQFPRQAIGQVQGNSFVHPVVQFPDNQHLPGPPQRPPAPDQMLQPPPHQIQGPGLPPVHLRPPGHNMFPQQSHPSVAADHFQQAIPQKLHAPFPHPEVPGALMGPGPSGPFGTGPSPFGPTQRNFELQSSASQGHHNQGHLPFPQPTGPRIHGDPMGGPPFGGPPSSAFDPQGGVMARGPLHGSEGHLDRIPFEQQSSKMNGGPGMGLSGGFPEPPYPFGSHDERFKPLPEERYKRLPEEGFKQFPRPPHLEAEPGRHGIDRREFEEDLKQFPRPPHLETEPVSKFESYLSSSRPLDRVPHGLSHDGGSSRLLPPYHPDGLRSTGLRDDIMGRMIDPATDFGRSSSEGRVRMDGLPPMRSPGREFPNIPSSKFGRQDNIEGRDLHMFGERSKPFSLPSEGSTFHESRFPILPSHLRRGELDGPGNLRIGEQLTGAGPMHLKSGDLVGRDVPPSHLRGGEPLGLRNFPSHLNKGDSGGFGSFPGPGNLPLNLRIGEPIGGNLPSHSRSMDNPNNIPVHGFPDGGFFNAGDKEPFDHSRKRKPGMGWCLLCKVDCETMEGLDLHSQTREHQNMALDMVLSIKKNNAKKQKPSSDDLVSHEDAHKSQKAGIESHGN